MKRSLLVLAIVATIAWPLSTAHAGLPSRTDDTTPADSAKSGDVALSSGNYSVQSESTGLGGARVQSASYSVTGSAIGEFGAGSAALVSSANYSSEIGYVGQLGGLQGPITAISRKTHGAVGDFDIGLPFSGPVGIECRAGGGSGVYKLVVTFAEPITVSSASVVSGTGMVPPGGAGASGNQITVNLTGVANAQTIFVTLFGVSDGPNTADVSVAMGMLIGDTNGNRTVNASDIGQTKSRLGEALNGINFRNDVNANGDINSTDIALVKSKSGSALP